jgi:hypothetical protein
VRPQSADSLRGYGQMVTRAEELNMNESVDRVGFQPTISSGTKPPGGCQPPMTDAEWEARGWRLWAIRATLPTRCPQCGSSRIVDRWRDDFDGRRCEDCGAVFCARS